VGEVQGRQLVTVAVKSVQHGAVGEIQIGQLVQGAGHIRQVGIAGEIQGRQLVAVTPQVVEAGIAEEAQIGQLVDLAVQVGQGGIVGDIQVRQPVVVAVHFGQIRVVREIQCRQLVECKIEPAYKPRQFLNPRYVGNALGLRGKTRYGSHVNVIHFICRAMLERNSRPHSPLKIRVTELHHADFPYPVETGVGSIG